jgi:hypothetical protein
MPNRRAETYTELFERLKQEASAMGKPFEPKRVVSDYEAALIPVIRQQVRLLFSSITLLLSIV